MEYQSETSREAEHISQEEYSYQQKIQKFKKIERDLRVRYAAIMPSLEDSVKEDIENEFEHLDIALIADNPQHVVSDIHALDQMLNVLVHHLKCQ